MPGLRQRRARRLVSVLALVATLCTLGVAGAGGDELRPYVVTGDAIPASLTGAAGDPERGRAIVSNRQVGLCLLCHTGPFPNEHFQGNLAPDLTGAGGARIRRPTPITDC